MLVDDFHYYHCSYSLMLVDDMTLNDVVWFGWMISKLMFKFVIGLHFAYIIEFFFIEIKPIL